MLKRRRSQSPEGPINSEGQSGMLSKKSRSGFESVCPDICGTVSPPQQFNVQDSSYRLVPESEDCLGLQRSDTLTRALLHIEQQKQPQTTEGDITVTYGYDTCFGMVRII